MSQVAASTRLASAALGDPTIAHRYTASLPTACNSSVSKPRTISVVTHTPASLRTAPQFAATERTSGPVANIKSAWMEANGIFYLCLISVCFETKSIDIFDQTGFLAAHEDDQGVPLRRSTFAESAATLAGFTGIRRQPCEQFSRQYFSYVPTPLLASRPTADPQRIIYSTPSSDGGGETAAVSSPVCFDILSYVPASTMDQAVVCQYYDDKVAILCL